MLGCRTLIVSMITPFILGAAKAAACSWNMAADGGAIVLIHV